MSRSRARPFRSPPSVLAPARLPRVALYRHVVVSHLVAGFGLEGIGPEQLYGTERHTQVTGVTWRDWRPAVACQGRACRGEATPDGQDSVPRLEQQGAMRGAQRRNSSTACPIAAAIRCWSWALAAMDASKGSVTYSGSINAPGISLGVVKYPLFAGPSRSKCP